MGIDDKSLKVLASMADEEPETFLYVVAELSGARQGVTTGAVTLERLAMELTGAGVDITAVFDDYPEVTRRAFGGRPDVSLEHPP